MLLLQKFKNDLGLTYDSSFLEYLLSWTSLLPDFIGSFLARILIRKSCTRQFGSLQYSFIIQIVI